MGGKVLRTTDLGGESFFYGHLMLREGLFMAAGYCFLKVWLVLLERSIKPAESRADYTSLCCASIWGDHLSQSSWPTKGLSKPRGMLCHGYLGDRLHKCKHRHINTCICLCTKTLTCRNTGTDAQSKTCTFMNCQTEPWWPEMLQI